ncbi:uncharacterized protein LOC135820245 [Sycon ciliatum]|uniref:uncharacterized protein LOC135820245 n=1 Tax=Sycon ciliatum TaxID=27933 RepID=UPI0031F6BDD7
MRTLAILMLICMGKMALAEPETNQNVTRCGSCHCRGNNVISCPVWYSVYVEDIVLTNITPGVFDKMFNRAIHLGLSRLHVENVAPGSFNKNVERILLSENNITSVQRGIFSGMLEELSLPGNRLTALPEDLLTDCPHLRSLNICNNKLRELPSGLFRSNPKLDSLYLSNTLLSELPSGLFTHNPIIRSVYFYMNHFRLNHHLCELVAPRNYMKAVYDFRPSMEVKNYIKENLSESFCYSSCENIPKNERICESGCIGTVYNYTCVADADATSGDSTVGQQSPVPTPEVNKTNPAFTEHTGKMVVFYLPAVKHGYSRQLVGIGQHGSVYVSQEFKNSYVGDRSYMFLKSGYDRYGFQYVRYSDGRTSPVGAEFSVVVKEFNPDVTDHTGALVRVHLPAVKPGYTRQLVEIGQRGAVDVSMRWNSERPDDTTDYVKQTPGFHVYGFQYVCVINGLRSPIGAKFSVGTPPEGKCGVVPTIDFGEYQVVDAGVGNVATYHCSPGYHMIGSGLVICQENGQWSEAPSCHSYCQPLLIPNGRIEEVLINYNGHNGSSLPLAQVEPRCERGFDSVGKATCSGERAGWEYETPLCDTVKNVRKMRQKENEAKRLAKKQAGSGNGGSGEGNSIEQSPFEEGPASEASQSVESLAGKTSQLSKNGTKESTVLQA